MSGNKILQLIVVIVALIGVAGRSIFAQELGYSGISPVNSGFGGVAVAAPIDGSAAIYWNPATISAFEKREFQFGFGRTSPPWYGDESLGYTLLLPVLGIYLAVKDSDDIVDDVVDSFSGGNSNGNSSDNSSAKDNKIPKTRNFNISFIGERSPYSHWNYGFAMTETAQRKWQFHVDSNTGQVTKAKIYRIRNIELAPAVSWWNKHRLSLGISPIFSIDEHPNLSLPISSDEIFLGDYRGHVGFGLQLGVYYQAKIDWNFGFSIKSPIWIPSQTYRWENMSTGEIRVRRSDFSQDSPLRFAFGLSYSGFTNALLAMDVRYYDFQHVGSLYDFSSNARKRTVTSLGLGAQYEVNDGVTLRIGYQYTDGCGSTFDDLVYNTTLPLQRGHSMHYGISLGAPESWDITFSGSHTFGEQKIHLADGSSLGANPNNSTFWWGLRFYF